MSKNAAKMASSEDTDQTAPWEQSDPSLHCLLMPLHLNIYSHYGTPTIGEEKTLLLEVQLNPTKLLYFELDLYPNTGTQQ